jgi:3-hydroxyisobutyrate dehydrogenase-like beta-hydroxyacid dehydrogenase
VLRFAEELSMPEGSARVRRVGLVGVGSMGMPVLRRLATAGYSMRVFARRPAAIDEARAAGATPVDSLAELGSLSDIVIVNVFSDDQVREVALGDDGVVAHMGAGSVLVNHATGRPSTLEVVAATASSRGIDTLDAAMSGGPHDIEAGKLTLLVGGDVDVLERVRPVLASYSSPILHVGAAGDGQKVKLLNNALFAAQVALVRRVEVGATELGMDPGLVLAAIRACSGESYALGTAVMIGSAAGLVEAARRYLEKDVAVCGEVADELGVDLEAILAVARPTFSAGPSSDDAVPTT